MRRLISIVGILFMCMPAFAQKACTFQTPDNKPRHDQYSKSSKKNIDESKDEMTAQANEFDKKKYQADVKGKNIKGKKNKSSKHEDKSALRFH